MSLFGYREKRYGKFAFIVLAILSIALAVGAVWGGVYAVLHMAHWSKYIIIVVASIFGLVFGFFGIFLLLLSFSMINSWKSVRDGNKSIGTANKLLCEKCGRVIAKGALFCEHCGAKQQLGHGMKDCPECKTKNSGDAKFCEHCGYEFKE